MKKIVSYIAGAAVALVMAACSSGFDNKKATELLEKPTLTAEEYTELINLYETGMNDAIDFSQKDKDKLSQEEQEEVMTFFAIGIRLSKDEKSLTSEQIKEIERINNLGNEKLAK